MRKILLSFIILLFFATSAQTLKGGVSHDFIPKGFFGSWGVISKLENSNNPPAFNLQSKDIWTLSGYGNVLILENLESGAHSHITIKEKSIDGKTLKFNRTKEIRTKTGINKQYETVEFKLSGKNFSGTDNFVVEYYDRQNNLIKTDSAQYKIEGVKISGD